MQRRLFQEATLLVALVLLVTFSVWRNPAFSSRENWQIIAREAALFGILGIGETLVILTGGIDLAPGSLVTLSGVVVAYLLVFAHLSMPLAFSLVLLMGLLIGWCMACSSRNFGCRLSSSRWARSARRGV
jgi:ribose transport system permease protein